MNFTWRGAKVFITGINGFVGGNVAKKLVELGADVYGLIRTNKYNSYLYFEKIDKKVSSWIGNWKSLIGFRLVGICETLNFVFDLLYGLPQEDEEQEDAV